jgi:hypothetical protein
MLKTLLWKIVKEAQTIIDSHKNKCESCKKGYNGRNGNGYQPCGCKPIGEGTPPTDMGD